MFIVAIDLGLRFWAKGWGLHVVQIWHNCEAFTSLILWLLWEERWKASIFLFGGEFKSLTSPTQSSRFTIFSQLVGSMNSEFDFNQDMILWLKDSLKVSQFDVILMLRFLRNITVQAKISMFGFLVSYLVAASRIADFKKQPSPNAWIDWKAAIMQGS